jgi:hypothetical protein
MPRLHPDLSRRSQFSWLHFLFPEVKTALKIRGFRMPKTLREAWRPKWTLFLWRPLLTLFRKVFFNDSTRVFKKVDITLIRNTTVFYFLLRRGLISLWLYKENKLRDENYIYSTYSPLSSTHLWLRCSNFFNPSKKNSFGCAASKKIRK